MLEKWRLTGGGLKLDMSRMEIEPHVLLSYKTKWFNSFWKFNEASARKTDTMGRSRDSLAQGLLGLEAQGASLMDRKNFSVSIPNSKESGGPDDRQPVNKNYTFQYNSEAKKIISNANDNFGTVEELQVRASLGAKTGVSGGSIGSLKVQSLHSISEKRDFKKSLKAVALAGADERKEEARLKIPEVVIIEESNGDSKRDSNLFELGVADSDSKKSPKFLESHTSSEQVGQTILTDRLSFRGNSRENLVLENRSANLEQRDQSQPERANPSSLNLSLEDFQKVEKIVYKESQKIEEIGTGEQETQETQELPKRVINGMEVEVEGGLDEGAGEEGEEDMDDFEKHFLGEDNDLGNFWDEKAEQEQESAKESKAEELSMRSEMSIDNAIRNDFAKAKEMTVTENLSHLKLEDVMKLDTMRGPELIKDDLFGLKFEDSVEDEAPANFDREKGFKKS